VDRFVARATEALSTPSIAQDIIADTLAARTPYGRSCGRAL